MLSRELALFESIPPCSFPIYSRMRLKRLRALSPRTQRLLVPSPLRFRHKRAPLKQSCGRHDFVISKSFLYYYDGLQPTSDTFVLSISLVSLLTFSHIPPGFDARSGHDLTYLSRRGFFPWHLPVAFLRLDKDSEVGTSASLVVTGALLVVTRSY